MKKKTPYTFNVYDKIYLFISPLIFVIYTIDKVYPHPVKNGVYDSCIEFVNVSSYLLLSKSTCRMLS